MAQNCECRVTLEDVAEKAGFLPLAAVAHQAKGLRLDVREDWAGRPSVAVADAARLYAAVTGSAEEANRTNANRLRAEEQATAAREAAEREIFDGAYNSAVRSGKGSPAAYSEAGEAVKHARTVGTVKKIADAARKAAGIR